MIPWRGKPDVSRLTDRSVCLRFGLQFGTKLYAFCFAKPWQEKGVQCKNSSHAHFSSTFSLMMEYPFTEPVWRAR